MDCPFPYIYNENSAFHNPYKDEEDKKKWILEQHVEITELCKPSGSKPHRRWRGPRRRKGCGLRNDLLPTWGYHVGYMHERLRERPWTLQDSTIESTILSERGCEDESEKCDSPSDCSNHNKYYEEKQSPYYCSSNDSGYDSFKNDNDKNIAHENVDVHLKSPSTLLCKDDTITPHKIGECNPYICSLNFENK